MWDDIKDSVRDSVLGPFGFKTAEDWSREGEKPCKLCGPFANHWWNRCVRIWAATTLGENFLGTTKAADKVREMLMGAHPINSVEELKYCFECTTLENAEDAFRLLMDSVEAEPDDTPDDVIALMRMLSDDSERQGSK